MIALLRHLHPCRGPSLLPALPPASRIEAVRTAFLGAFLASVYVVVLGLSTVPIIKAAGDSGIEGYSDPEERFARYAVTQVRFAQHAAGRLYPLQVAAVESEPGDQACGPGSVYGAWEATVVAPGPFGLPAGRWIVTCDDTDPSAGAPEVLVHFLWLTIVLWGPAALLPWLLRRRASRSLHRPAVTPGRGPIAT